MPDCRLLALTKRFGGISVGYVDYRAQCQNSDLKVDVLVRVFYCYTPVVMIPLLW